jgi:hypothetical protein
MTIKPQYDAAGRLNFWYVLPSRHLANLLERKLMKQYPQLNYRLAWKDVRGAGLNLTVVDWVPAGRVYNVPD